MIIIRARSDVTAGSLNNVRTTNGGPNQLLHNLTLCIIARKQLLRYIVVLLHALKTIFRLREERRSIAKNQ